MQTCTPGAYLQFNFLDIAQGDAVTVSDSSQLLATISGSSAAARYTASSGTFKRAFFYLINI